MQATGEKHTFGGATMIAEDVRRQASQAVCRIVEKQGDFNRGTGFMVMPGFVITNHHVIGSKQACADYYLEFRENRKVIRVDLKPDHFFVTSSKHADRAGQHASTRSTTSQDANQLRHLNMQHLDYTMIAFDMKPELDEIGKFPIRLHTWQGNHSPTHVHIPSYPDGGQKLLWSTGLKRRKDTQSFIPIRYHTETNNGSSGAPVLTKVNNHLFWYALHREGRLLTTPRQIRIGGVVQGSVGAINQGIRSKEIVESIAASQPFLATWPGSQTETNLIRRFQKVWDYETSRHTIEGDIRRVTAELNTLSSDLREVTGEVRNARRAVEIHRRASNTDTAIARWVKFGGDISEYSITFFLVPTFRRYQTHHESLALDADKARLESRRRVKDATTKIDTLKASKGPLERALAAKHAERLTLMLNSGVVA